MKKYINVFFAILFPIFAFSQPFTIIGKVTKCSDGDSYRVQDSTGKVYVIREHNADSPEKQSIYVTANQPYGLEAAKKVRDLLKGKTVRVEVLYKDQYGRNIGETYLDSLHVNHYLVLNGLAWYRPDTKVVPSAQEDADYKAWLAIAKQKKYGLWGQKGTKIAPWTWRARHKPTTHP